MFFCRALITQAQRQPQVAREEYDHVVDDHWKSVVKTAAKKVKHQKIPCDCFGQQQVVVVGNLSANTHNFYFKGICSIPNLHHNFYTFTTA